MVGDLDGTSSCVRWWRTRRSGATQLFARVDLDHAIAPVEHLRGVHTLAFSGYRTANAAAAATVASCESTVPARQYASARSSPQGNGPLIGDNHRVGAACSATVSPLWVTVGQGGTHLGERA